MNCILCSKEIKERRKITRKYCSKKCWYKTQEEERRRLNPRFNVRAGVAGAIQELIVSADLMKKGYEVFRSVSPTCSCDLITHHKGKLLKIEVTTGYINTNGKIYHSHMRDEKGRQDIMAIVLWDKIVYEPKMEAVNDR